MHGRADAEAVGMSRFFRENPEWDPADEFPIFTEPPVVRCKCSHGESQHGTDRKGRLICYGSTVCGCIEFRRAA